MSSQRLPGKPLLKIDNEPLIIHVWRHALEANIAPVYVATESPQIAEVVDAVGGNVIMTKPSHPSGSDRVFEAVEKIDPQNKFTEIINLQGDQLLLPKNALNAALSMLKDPLVDIGTLASLLSAPEATDPNAVKLIGTQISPERMRALYFTRAAAPWGEGEFYRHIGVYAYRRAALARFAALTPSALEQREKLEQLRALESGMRIDVKLLDKAGASVDTQRDIRALNSASCS